MISHVAMPTWSSEGVAHERTRVDTHIDRTLAHVDDPDALRVACNLKRYLLEGTLELAGE